MGCLRCHREGGLHRLGRPIGDPQVAGVLPMPTCRALRPRVVEHNALHDPFAVRARAGKRHLLSDMITATVMVTCACAAVWMETSRVRPQTMLCGSRPIVSGTVAGGVGERVLVGVAVGGLVGVALGVEVGVLGGAAAPYSIAPMSQAPLPAGRE